MDQFILMDPEYWDRCNEAIEFFKNNNVPIIVVEPEHKANALMCIAYGAYGLPTNMSTMRWKPYIDNGWIIAFVCVRGSGDKSKAWADSARNYNKVLSFVDFETARYLFLNAPTFVSFL